MKYIDQLIERYPCLNVCKKEIEESANALIESFKNGGKLLVAGNGGSCADSDHMMTFFFCVATSFLTSTLIALSPFIRNIKPGQALWLTKTDILMIHRFW